MHRTISLLIQPLQMSIHVDECHHSYYESITRSGYFSETQFSRRHQEHHQEELGEVAEPSRQRNKNTQRAHRAASRECRSFAGLQGVATQCVSGDGVLQWR